MLDIQLIRNDRSSVAAALQKRLSAQDVERLLDEILALDAHRRELIQHIDRIRAERNARSREIAAAVKAGEAFARPENLIDPGDAEERLRDVEGLFDLRMSELPNMPADDVGGGGKESNVVVRSGGHRPSFANPAPHWEIATRLDLVDFRRGVSLSGSGFWMYRGIGAQLEWALINFFIAQNLAAGYLMLMPPHIVLPSAGRAAGQFPKFADDVYHTTDPSGLFLIPTAETAIAGAYADEIFDEAQLPFKAFAYTPCYRRERAGEHADERGTVRGHQFNKVEIFQFVAAEHAADALQEMVAHVEGLMTKLGLHHQTSLLAANDTSASMRKTVDVEVWMPSTGKYKEVSSVSWAGDYQARRASMRYRSTSGRGTRFVHTLNGSSLATSRVFPAILEQHQQADGSVFIPDVLRPYMSGIERISAAAKGL